MVSTHDPIKHYKNEAREPKVGDIVRGLSHRGEGIKHGETVVIEGRIVAETFTPNEFHVRYNSRIIVDDEDRAGGYFNANELDHLSWREQ